MALLGAVVMAASILAVQVPEAKPSDVPEGVVYHRASQELLDATRAALENAFSNHRVSSEAGSPFSETVTCGPFLWKQLSTLPTVDEVDTVPVRFIIPKSDGTIQQFDGRLFRGSAVDLINSLIREQCANSDPPTVTLPNRYDLSIYWTLIPYEIEEPVFVLQCGATRWFLDFDEQQKIVWIDDFTESAQIVGHAGQE